MFTADPRPLAVVTGASAGIGYELARCCAKNGFELVIAADGPAIQDAAHDLRNLGAPVIALEIDLATEEGVDEVCEAIGDRRVEALLVDAGHGLLIQRVARAMRKCGEGRILLTGPVAGPAPVHTLDNGTKAFLHSFSNALRGELEGTQITVTCLMPGDANSGFFEQADMLDCRGGTGEKDDPANVASDVFRAMMAGEAEVG